MLSSPRFDIVDSLSLLLHVLPLAFMTPKPQFPSYFTGHSFSIFPGGSSFTPESLQFKLSQGSDFDSFLFNNYNIFQSCLLSWFLLSVKFPSQNALVNSRLAGILHCLLDISTWMTNRHLNIFRSKIEFLVSPPQTYSSHSFPFSINDNCTNRGVRPKNHRIILDIPYSSISNLLENPMVSTFKIYPESD